MLSKVSSYFISFVGYLSVPGVLLWLDLQTESLLLILIDFQFNSGEALLVWMNVLFIIFKIAEKTLAMCGVKITFKRKK